MNFGEALQAAKSGRKIAREGWNGKGQFVVRAGGYAVALDKVREGTHFTKEFLQSEGATEMPIEPHLDIWNAQKKYVPGWAPSQGDMFAEDWTVLP
jgi:hypothetical protein